MQTTPRRPRRRLSLQHDRLFRLAIPFYGALAGAAALVRALDGRTLAVTGRSIPLGLAAGAATACATVLLGALAFRAVPVVRDLAEEMAPLLFEGASAWSLVCLALLSGIGEEAMFRGALQPVIGIVWASLLFGLLHVGPDRRYLIWTGWAVLAGFLFGALYEWTGGLLAPVTAHALHNAATLLLWRRRAGIGVGGEPAA